MYSINHIPLCHHNISNQTIASQNASKKTCITLHENNLNTQTCQTICHFNRLLQMQMLLSLLSGFVCTSNKMIIQVVICRQTHDANILSFAALCHIWVHVGFLTFILYFAYRYCSFVVLET